LRRWETGAGSLKVDSAFMALTSPDRIVAKALEPFSLN
jgi:hypothetical protein